MIWYTYEIHTGTEVYHFETLANTATAAFETIGDHVERWQLNGHPFQSCRITHELAVKVEE